jgi:hypothetical protein
LGNRKAIHHRRVRTIAYKQVVFLDVTYGEYRACCHCCTTFRTTLPGVEPRALYDNKVREAVLDRILKDGMSVERVIASMGRDFLLNLWDVFVYDCLDWQVRQLDLADHRRWVLDHFSGTLCVDELHLGQMTLLLATDPLNDLPVAFALVAGNGQPHMRRFLKNLKTWGLSPAVVVTDGSNLYPTILAELWPDARHHLCVFHVLKDLHEQVLDAVRQQRRAMSRRGQPGAEAAARAAAQGPGETAGADEQGEVVVRAPAPPPDREAAGEDDPPGADRPGDDAELPARVEGAAGLRRPPGDALRGGPDRGVGLGAGDRPGGEPSFPRGP